MSHRTPQERTPREEDSISPEETKANLARLSLLFIHLLNTRDFDSLLQVDWIDTSFAAASDYQGPQEYIDLETHVARFKEHVEEFPTFLVNHTATQVELDKQTATVFVNGDHSGCSPGMTIPGVGMFAWHRVKANREWLLCKVVALRGSVSSSRSMDPF